jgi:mRNA-degrading endonuclease YafQ of YafQ-DinJ toxin-antitoxin module
MKILYSVKFLKLYNKLSNEIKDRVEEKESLIIENIFDSSLKTHKLHGNKKDFWAISVDYKIRILFKFEGDNTVKFYYIGDHDIY